MSTDPLTSTFGVGRRSRTRRWRSPSLPTCWSIPGRSCSNGVPVPTKDPAWATFVQQVRDASMKAYNAAQAKDQDKIIELSEALSASCEGCHRKWRDRRRPDNRCKEQSQPLRRDSLRVACQP